MAQFVTVTPNPAIDVTYTVEEQAIGDTIRVSQVRRVPGGKGINVARVLRGLGCDVTAVVPLGGDQGRWVQEELARIGLPAVSCPVAGATRTTVAIVDGIVHPTLYAEPGDPLSESEWGRLSVAVRENAAPAGWVVIAGSCPPHSTAEHLASLIDAAHAAGARVLVDTSGPLLATATLSGADVIKANEAEICEAAGTFVLDDALRTLGGRGVTVMMTRGADGAMLRMPDGARYEQPGVPAVTGSPIGAGDAATAGFVAHLADQPDQADPAGALRWSVVCGAAAVLSDIAGEIDREILPALAQRAPIGARVETDSHHTMERSIR